MPSNSERDEGLTEALEGIWYTVDRELTIRSVSRKNWEISAKINNLSNEFSADNIIGKPLMEFIHGEETRSTYERFCEAILTGRRDSISLVHNCDAPGVRRHVRLSIRPFFRNATIVGAVFHNIELSAAPRPPIELLLNGTAEGMEQTCLAICTFCRNVRLESDPRFADWMRAEEYYRRGGSSRVLLSHAICDDCQKGIVEPNS